ncbi:hypothetical protein DMB92_00125 [Campylobacter sp. MIT 99-7217]|uniref:hypothetical protein n=1 Tax=Campylobacter sp. MIT 99-7217 TaxID=535091 RepID=UPI0011581460|nr:hypothetical protein [Campylobacter sp. MIT 99-7217]TQR34412.1 hypothetical protein DMB92_00125 [Campylobacter sp. MIT 99-7217]
MQVNSASVANLAAQNVANKDEKKTQDSQTNTQSTASANAQSSSTVDQETLDKLKSLGGKGITQLYFQQFQQQSLNNVFGNLGTQSSITDLLSGNFGDSTKATSVLSQIDFASIGYTGKNPLSMNSDELNALLGENGFFGIENTASRIADFVIMGAGDDLDKLQKGFEGMKRGFEEAEKIWGGKLPQISQDTIDKAIEKVSAKITELGGNALNINA